MQMQLSLAHFGTPVRRGVSRLSIFLTDATTGRPLPRVAVYGELVIGDGLLVLPETKGITEIRANAPQLEPMVAEEMQSYFGLADRSVEDEYWPASILVPIAEALNENGLLKSGADVEEARTITRVVIEEQARRRSIPRATGCGARRYPLGVLSTDHVGFASFDLTRAGLPDSDTSDIIAAGQIKALIYPYLSDSLVIDVTAQGRIGLDALVGKIALDPKRFANAPALNLPALQNPSLVDWSISPGSFAATPLSLVGEDGCQSYTPANFATSQINLRQVVRIDKKVDRFPAARVLEYSVSFVPIGHSLGQVLYSLPLAPGESTRLAVVNWRRTNTGERTEDTIVTESLVHSQSRDRLITETVDAALDEWQRGGSVMGGMASGGGVSANLFSIVGLSGGHMLSAGGAYSTSSGTRTLAADTMQKVTDRIQQASTAVREMHSTVVLQTDQTETQAIETRAFANHNRGHTLNIMYHEVLQHFRVVTEFRRVYSAVLLPRLERDFNNDGYVLSMRHRLEPVTLDETLKPAGYDALKAIDVLRKDRERTPLVPPPPPWAGDIMFRRFRFQTRVDYDNTDNPVYIRLFRFSAPFVALMHEYSTGLAGQTGSDHNFNVNGAFDKENLDLILDTTELPVGIPWWDIDKFVVRMMAASGDMRLVQADVFGIDEAGVSHRLFWGQNISHQLENANNAAVLPAIRQQPVDRPVPIVPPATPELSVDIGTYYEARRLKEHLSAERDYYGRSLDLTDDPNAYARHFEELEFGSGKAIDSVAPTPLEILGSHIAFPLIDQSGITDKDRRDLLAEPARERLISLPTRGVFAEAKLGHCNVAEELDETRFWRWDEHPIPFLASDIAPVTPVQPTPQDPALTPTPLPTSVVNIQNVPSAPDPAGMAAALKLLGTADVFRDMSGRAEVGALLSDLIEGSVSMAEAANRARGIAGTGGVPGSAVGASTGSSGRGGGWDPSGGAKSPGGATSSGTGAATSPDGRRDSPREQLDQLQVYRAAVRGNEITPERAQELAEQYLSANAPTDPTGKPVALDGFKPFVDSQRVDKDIGLLLEEMHDFGPTAWPRRIAHFAHVELSFGNLLGMIRSSQINQLAALYPNDITPAIISNVINLGGVWGAMYPVGDKGFYVIPDVKIDEAKNSTQVRTTLKQTIAHELTHFRNRALDRAIRTATTASDAALFVDVSAAFLLYKPVETYAYFASEFLSRHVEWLVLTTMKNGTVDPVPAAGKLFNAVRAFADHFVDNGGVTSTWPYLNRIAYTTQAGDADRYRQSVIWLKAYVAQAAFDYDAATNTRIRAYIAKDLDAGVANNYGPLGNGEASGIVYWDF